MPIRSTHAEPGGAITSLANLSGLVGAARPSTGPGQPARDAARALQVGQARFL